jgi:hypothetical protein
MRGAVALSCLAASAAAAWPSPAMAAPASTLCRANELVVFSCSTGAHTASICASGDVSKSIGAMQYRFGRPGRLDLAYPDAGAKPTDVFTSGMMMFSGGGGAWLRFSKGAFRYTIFTAIGKWGPSESAADAAGVVVEKDGAAFANFPCRAGAVSEIGPDLFEKLGLKATDPSNDFDIPQAFFPNSSK